MKLKTGIKSGLLLGAALTTLGLSINAQAYHHGHHGSSQGSGMGMGMGSGSGSGYSGAPGYYRGPAYGYQRPPLPPMRPYGYQRPKMPPRMKPYGYQQPPMRPMPPMRPYGYSTAPMAPAASDAASQGGQTEAATNEIIVNGQGMAFQPSNITVEVGATVTWINNDRAPHTVTSTDSGPMASGTMNSGDRYSVTFDEAGTYNYYCKFHPQMQASVTVE